MWHLIWRTLRSGGAPVAVSVTLLGTAALVTAFAGLLAVGATARIAPQRYAAADAVVAAPAAIEVGGEEHERTERTTLPAELAATLAGVPGVTAAVGVVAFPAVAGGTDAAGHNWSSAVLAPYGLDGRAPGAGEVVVGGLDAEAVIEVVTADGGGTYVVSGTVASSTPVLFFEDAEAARLSGEPSRVEAIGILGDTGGLASALDGAATVHIGPERGAVEFPAAGAAGATLVELAASLGAATVLIAVLVVASALAISLHRRRGELATLRAVAATPRQAERLIVGQVVVLAGFASVVGAGLGLALLHALLAVLRTAGMLPGDLAYGVGPLPVVAGIAITVLIAAAAAWTGARRATRDRPARLMRRAPSGGEAGSGRTIVGVLLLPAGLAASLLPLFFDGIFPVAGAATAGLVMVVASVVLAPAIVRASIAVSGWWLRRMFGAEGRLAAASVRHQGRRVAAAAGPLFLMVGFATVQLALPATMSAGAAADLAAGVTADHVLSGGAAGIPRSTVDAVRATSGVLATMRATTTTVYAVTEILDSPEVFEYAATGVDPVDGLIDPGVLSGSLALAPDAVALSRTAAGSLGADVGDRVDLRLGDGTALNPVVTAVYGRGLGFGDVLLDHETVRAHTTGHVTDTLYVDAVPGTPLPHGTAPSAPTSGDTPTLLGGLLPLLLVFAYLSVSVTGTLAAAVGGRSGEFAALRLAGALPRQVRRIVTAEAVFLVGTAVAVGCLVPLVPLATIAYGLTGAPVPAVPPLVLGTLIAATAVVGLAAQLVPAWTATRGRPAAVTE